MQRVRLKKEISIDTLPFPAPEIILDDLQRVSILRYTHKSIIVTYTATWIGVTNTLQTYTQTIESRE